MSKLKISRLILGEGGLDNNSDDAEFSSGTLAPSDGDGKNGDVYCRIAGANSNIYVKRGGTWISLIGEAFNITIPNNSTNFVWLSIPSAAARFLRLNYGLTRSTSMRAADLSIMNDLTDTMMAEYGVLDIGADVGVTLNSQINGSNLELLATTTNTGTSVTMKYFIRSWN